MTFTSEGPEYWQFLASAAPDKVVALYRQHISPEVHARAPVSERAYDPRNRWNNSTANGAMHLIQANNTLGAEIELAAAATIVRIVNGRTLEAEQELIACGQYGQSERNSDPHIGAEVNALARAKADITLANPVGLCIAGLSTAGWQTPDGSPASDYWTVVRGTPEKALRAVYEVPGGQRLYRWRHHSRRQDNRIWCADRGFYHDQADRTGRPASARARSRRSTAASAALAQWRRRSVLPMSLPHWPIGPGFPGGEARSAGKRMLELMRSERIA